MKKATPRPKAPFKYIAVRGSEYRDHPGYILDKGYQTEQGAVNHAAEDINHHRGGANVFIYQLVKIVKPKEVPVEVEEIRA